jgi:ParB-like chromosome segregation protein Spo0J
MTLADQPLANVQWVERDLLVSNEWNPNHVAPPEMKLLRTSILEDGWTQPIVVQEVQVQGMLDHYQIVDGFHRWTVSADLDVRALTDGLVPVVVVTLDEAHARMSTIRHNRARGKHGVRPMADIVATLLTELALSDEEVSARLGMEPEEVNRLRDRGNMLKRGSSETGGFTEAWRFKDNPLHVPYS